jgi:hypothetical protein
MPAEFRLPFGALNAIPGVSDVDDTVIRVPTLDEIGEVVDNAVPSLDEIGQEVQDIIREEIRELESLFEAGSPFVDEVVAGLEDGLNIDFPDPDELVADIVDGVEDTVGDIGTVNIEGSLFSVEDDFVDLLAEAISSATLPEVDDFPSLQELDDRFESLREDIEGIEPPTAEDFLDGLSDALTDFFETVPGGDLILSPDEFIDNQIERVTDGLVDDGPRETLEEALEDGE